MSGSHKWIENKTKLTMRQEMVQICMPRGQKVRTMSDGLCHRTEKSSRAFSRLWLFLPKPFNELSMAAYFSGFSCIVFHVFLIIVTYSACHHTHLTDKPMMCFELIKSIVFLQGQKTMFTFRFLAEIFSDTYFSNFDILEWHYLELPPTQDSQSPPGLFHF